MSTPYIGFGNDQLDTQPAMEHGDRIVCPKCGGEHVIECGINEQGQRSNTIMFYRCGGELFMGGFNGKSVFGVTPACKGEI